MTDRQTEILNTLAFKLIGEGFDPMAEDIWEYIEDPSGWRSVGEFLGALQQDVWWHYGHVGEEADKYLYHAVERNIEHARAELYG